MRLAEKLLVFSEGLNSIESVILRTDSECDRGNNESDDLSQDNRSPTRNSNS